MIWAINHANAVFELQKVFATLTTYLIIRLLLRQTEGKVIPFILSCNLLVTLTVLAVVLWQVITYEDFDHLISRGFDKIPGLSAQRNLLCSFLYLTLIFNVLAVIYYRSKKWRWAYLIPIMIQVGVLLLFTSAIISKELSGLLIMSKSLFV